jgi:succinyl-CoA synthetase alpha subunit
MKRIHPAKGMLHYLVKKVRPDIAGKISSSGKIETIVVGLGTQGVKHAGLMKGSGTIITAGIAAGKEGTRIHETIPVYNNVSECLKEHPNIAVASIWRHYSNVRDVTIEVIDAGIPVVVLITEGIPLRDVRDILTAARKKGTLLFGGNTPGLIFPPEGIKTGMLPDVFYPEVISKDSFGPRGITIISRSGAILYHMSDALSSSGLAQNAVIGIGGDGAIGMTFRDIVPLVSKYKNTDLVVIAGEIGGSMEELLAEDIVKYPAKYSKSIVALISGANAPQGKTMGHAGAIVAPGTDYGTFESKKKALEKAGIPVVNSQVDLIQVVSKKLKGKKYYKTGLYYEDMAKKWEAAPKQEGWGTYITKVEPNSLVVAGYRLEKLIEKATLLETVYLIISGELPSKKIVTMYNKTACKAASLPVPETDWHKNEDISKFISRCLLSDQYISSLSQKTKDEQVKKTVFTMGRVAGYLSKAFNNKTLSTKNSKAFSDLVYQALTGSQDINKNIARMLEGLITASVDHGVTPPSAQATIIAASTRSAFELAVAQGVGVITDVHGGAGAKAAMFFRNCVAKAGKEGLTRNEAVHVLIKEYVQSGKVIEGIGHRIHTKDPRCESLWALAKNLGVSEECVAFSRIISDEFEKIRGISLPVNVDGVLGAIVSDIGLSEDTAKALFIWGRIAGLSAHYFEEITLYPPMRRIDFSQAVYKGQTLRKFPQDFK